MLEARKGIICGSNSKWSFEAGEGMSVHTTAFLNLYLLTGGGREALKLGAPICSPE